MIGENPVLLESEVLSRRIFAPRAYRLVRELPIVPIVVSEAQKIAMWFPIAWRMGENGPELVAMRSLLADQRGQPPRARDLLPLLLSAYPFVLDPAAPPRAGAHKMLDNVFADEPTDIGATIVGLDRKPVLATRLRLDALETFAAQYPATRSLGHALDEAKLLEAWPLEFDIGGRNVSVPNLFIAHRDAFESGRYAAILAQHGLMAAELLGLHRISLFRAGLLVTMARAVLEEHRTASSTAERSS
ncbi:MAG: SapC family protein [Methylacidiphilales bacterium]|nr:SapC family protein [Candidatus Methylacidiphilales bacterium]